MSHKKWFEENQHRLAPMQIEDVQEYCRRITMLAYMAGAKACQEGAAVVCENLEMSTDSLDTWDAGTLDCAEAVRAMNLEQT